MQQPSAKRPDTLSTWVYEAIRGAIIDKTIIPGSAVTESGLAEQLGVSKTPVREALLRLREERLVEVDDNRLRVPEVSKEALRHAYEVRTALESTAASLAAVRASESERTEIADIAARSVSAAQAGDYRGFQEWDHEFHSKIADAASNPYLTVAAMNALLLTRVLRARDAQMSGQQSVNCALDHVRIAEAISEKNEALAGRLATEHVGHVMTNVLGSFSTVEPPRNSGE